jgi:hypothetical protein
VALRSVSCGLELVSCSLEIISCSLEIAIGGLELGNRHYTNIAMDVTPTITTNLIVVESRDSSQADQSQDACHGTSTCDVSGGARACRDSARGLENPTPRHLGDQNCTENRHLDMFGSKASLTGLADISIAVECQSEMLKDGQNAVNFNSVNFCQTVDHRTADILNTVARTASGTSHDLDILHKVNGVAETNEGHGAKIELFPEECDGPTQDDRRPEITQEESVLERGSPEVWVTRSLDSPTVETKWRDGDVVFQAGGPQTRLFTGADPVDNLPRHRNST